MIENINCNANITYFIIQKITFPCNIIDHFNINMTNFPPRTTCAAIKSAGKKKCNQYYLMRREKSLLNYKDDVSSKCGNVPSWSFEHHLQYLEQIFQEHRGWFVFVFNYTINQCCLPKWILLQYFMIRHSNSANKGYFI